jgi:hypothetical protein
MPEIDGYEVAVLIAIVLLIAAYLDRIATLGVALRPLTPKSGSKFFRMLVRNMSL